MATVKFLRGESRQKALADVARTIEQDAVPRRMHMHYDFNAAVLEVDIPLEMELGGKKVSIEGGPGGLSTAYFKGTYPERYAVIRDVVLWEVREDIIQGVLRDIGGKADEHFIPHVVRAEQDPKHPTLRQIPRMILQGCAMGGAVFTLNPMVMKAVMQL